MIHVEFVPKGANNSRRYVCPPLAPFFEKMSPTRFVVNLPSRINSSSRIVVATREPICVQEDIVVVYQSGRFSQNDCMTGQNTRSSASLKSTKFNVSCCNNSLILLSQPTLNKYSQNFGCTKGTSCGSLLLYIQNLTKYKALDLVSQYQLFQDDLM